MAPLQTTVPEWCYRPYQEWRGPTTSMLLMLMWAMPPAQYCIYDGFPGLHTHTHVLYMYTDHHHPYHGMYTENHLYHGMYTDDHPYRGIYTDHHPYHGMYTDNLPYHVTIILTMVCILTITLTVVCILTIILTMVCILTIILTMFICMHDEMSPIPVCPVDLATSSFTYYSSRAMADKTVMLLHKVGVI